MYNDIPLPLTPLAIKCTSSCTGTFHISSSTFLSLFFSFFSLLSLFLPYLIGFLLPCSFDSSHASLSPTSIPRLDYFYFRCSSLFCSLSRVFWRKFLHFRPPGVFWAVLMSKIFGFSGESHDFVKFLLNFLCL